MSVELETEINVKEKIKEVVKEPGKYKVIFANDNETPMDFVVLVLISIFRKPPQQAYDIMMSVHEKGRGIAGGPYSKEIAETKAEKTMAFARQNGYPLKVTFEKE